MVALQPVSVRPFIERATENAGIEDRISLFDTAIHKLTGFPCRCVVPHRIRKGCSSADPRCASVRGFLDQAVGRANDLRQHPCRRQEVILDRGHDSPLRRVQLFRRKAGTYVGVVQLAHGRHNCITNKVPADVSASVASRLRKSHG
jgi:hypothetical protein